MKMIDVKNGPQKISRIVLGCMRMPALSVYEAAKMIETSVEMGINYFDMRPATAQAKPRHASATRFRRPASGEKTFTFRASADCTLTRWSLTGARKTF